MQKGWVAVKYSNLIIRLVGQHLHGKALPRAGKGRHRHLKNVSAFECYLLSWTESRPTGAWALLSCLSTTTAVRTAVYRHCCCLHVCIRIHTLMLPLIVRYYIWNQAHAWPASTLAYVCFVLKWLQNVFLSWRAFNLHRLQFATSIRSVKWVPLPGFY